jgi:hypothetical protein
MTRRFLKYWRLILIGAACIGGTSPFGPSTTFLSAEIKPPPGLKAWEIHENRVRAVLADSAGFVATGRESELVRQSNGPSQT